MLDETKEIAASDGPGLNLSDQARNEQEKEDDLLYLIAEIIVEIIVSEKNERNRIHSEK